MATYLPHCSDAFWLATILTDITVPNRLIEIATHRRLLAPIQPTSSLETRRMATASTNSANNRAPLFGASRISLFSGGSVVSNSEVEFHC